VRLSLLHIIQGNEIVCHAIFWFTMFP
jgi:hypothetical protein